MADRFEDYRGLIEDINLSDEPLNGVITRIFTRAGAVRGNHTHKLTTQWTYVLSGRLLTATPSGEVMIPAGVVIEEPPGVPHAWRAEEDTVVLVFTRGPRSGEDYESDTIRLALEDRLLTEQEPPALPFEQFGPGSPIRPVPVDYDPDAPRPEPRPWTYPFGLGGAVT